MNGNSVTVRKHGSQESVQMSLEDYVTMVTEEVNTKKLFK